MDLDEGRLDESKRGAAAAETGAFLKVCPTECGPARPVAIVPMQ